MFSLSAVINPIKLRSCGSPYNRWRQSYPWDQLNHQEIVYWIVYHNKNHVENLFNKHLSGKRDAGDDMRPSDSVVVDIIFISTRGPCYSNCQFHSVFVVNMSVGLMTRYQNLTADGEGLTVISFHPQLMEVTVMWHRQVTRVNWQVYFVALFGKRGCEGGLAKL